MVPYVDYFSPENLEPEVEIQLHIISTGSHSEWKAREQNTKTVEMNS